VPPRTARPSAHQRPTSPPPAGGPHPPDEPGPYRLPAALRRFLVVRAPRCEWPSCGARAHHCDQDHDDAWPFGPTCACNLGALCRRHHRTKQLGWTKQRTPDGVRWSSPTGRTWLSPWQHTAPADPVRPLPTLTGPELDHAELDHAELDLGPLALDAEQCAQHPDDPTLTGADDTTTQPEDDDPTDDTDPLEQRLRTGSTRWTLDLDDTDAWQDVPAPEHC